LPQGKKKKKIKNNEIGQGRLGAVGGNFKSVLALTCFSDLGEIQKTATYTSKPFTHDFRIKYVTFWFDTLRL
jgi:hypothetical protein